MRNKFTGNSRFLFIFNFILPVSRICKDGFDFQGAAIAVFESIHHHLSNLQNESAAFSLGSDFTEGGGLSMVGFNGVEVTVLGPCTMAA